jgi:hypothetical protein
MYSTEPEKYYLAMCIATAAVGKRKSQSNDDFLGVLTTSGNVVDVCDIPTTTVMVAAGDWRPDEVCTGP